MAGLGLMAAFEQVNGTLVATTGRRDETASSTSAPPTRAATGSISPPMRGYKLDRGARRGATSVATPTGRGVARTIGKVTLTGAVYHVNVKNTAGQP